MYYFVNKEKYSKICIYSVWFYFTLLDCAYFRNEIEKCRHWNISIFYNQWKILSDLNMSHGKMSDFLSFPFFGFPLAIKPRKPDFESHWNILIFFDKKWFVSDLNMSDGKVSDFVSF